jgi:spermidine synthase
MRQFLTVTLSYFHPLEILRDYGFVESFPQIWHYLGGDMQFELDVNEDGGFDLKWMAKRIPNNDDRPGSIVWLHRQIRRLRQVRNVNYKDGNPGMPEREWTMAWEFQRANIQAMTVAAASLEAIEAGKTDDKEMSELQSGILVSDFEEDASHYDKLDWEFDDLEYVAPTCNNKELMKFHDHVVVEELKTHYQSLNFAIHPGTMDVVMDLDNIVQISSNYRPQYHEYVTHAAARFVKDIKRVIFIGGGDSMLLHETLKYPDLELVVGLELDQMVTRKCFKYFRSSPHFEDPRVEWWFGDATKSLNLLAKEYWQSFDLVLVDLSETVMSLSVTKELDVFDALALLLQPDGVMVKNEVYMEPLSKVFDYSMDILYESPVICSQVIAFGSNKVEFVHDEVYDHEIETFLYKNMHDPDTRHDFSHDWRMNNATEQGKCGELPVLPKLDEQARSAGLVAIVEAENVSVTLDESLGDTFVHIIEQEGFRPLAAPVFESGMMMIVMKEGYIMARMWPGAKYCNLDINLWGKFHKLNELQQSLTDAMGSGLVSKFRIVVGGMYGSDTWSEDREIIGPQIVQTRNCDIPVHGEAPEMGEELITAAFNESMSLIRAKEITAIALCKNAHDCLAVKLLSKYDTVRKTVAVSACKNLKADDVDSKYACEVDMTLFIKSKLGNDKADLVIVDSSASYELVQILNSVLSRNKYRQDIIREQNMFMVWSMNAEEEEYQRFFLDRYRKQHEWDPIGRAEFRMQAGKKAIEFGVLSAGDKKVVYKMADMEATLKDTFKDKKNVEIELRGIYGGLYEYKQKWEPQEFLQSDYDTEADYEHYYDQKPLARHTVFQLEEAEGKTFEFSKDSLNFALAKSLDAVGFECTTRYSYVGIGEGVVMLCMNPYKGSTILVWDGRKHIDISYYLMGDEEGEPEKFMGAFLHHVGRKLSVALRDDMPRGTGRVINFAGDLRTREELKDFYDNMESYDHKAGEEEEEEEAEEEAEEDEEAEENDSADAEL